MFSKGQKKGTIRFSVTPTNGTRKVQLAGDFTDWQPLDMRKQKNGSFVANLPLGAGVHQYKFILDGEWIVDSDNNSTAVNSLGTINSIAHVE